MPATGPAGPLEGAVETLRAAAAARPQDPRLEAQVAETLIRLGRGHEAVAGLERALQRLGGCAELWYQLGAAQLAIRQPEAAVASYRACLLLYPGSATILNNIGAALLQAGRPDEAIGCFEAALTAAPGYVRPLVNLGKVLREVGRLREALVRLREALAHSPENPAALVNLGDALTDGGEYAEAAAVLERVVAGHPRLTEARVSLGHCYLRSGAIDVATETLERAVEQDPTHSEARFLLGYTRFLAGAWRRAWPLFEHRHTRALRPIVLAVPAGLERWDGTLRPGTTLVLVAEQGLGDTLQFARYAQVLIAHGVQPVLHCQKPLARLMELSGLFAAVASLGAPPPPGATAWYPLMSLPALFETEPGTVPAAAGYLTVERGRVAAWRARLPAAAKLRVGIAWQGNPLAERGELRGRSPPLAEFGPLAALPGVALVSLQKDAGVEQLATVPFRDRVTTLDGLDAGSDAFLDTSAVMQSLDLVIASDTAVAHLAGAFGRPVWVALTHHPDWRWMLGTDRTPWYASMRLFRQPAHGQWASVFAEIAAAAYSRDASPTVR